MLNTAMLEHLPVWVFLVSLPTDVELPIIVDCNRTACRWMEYTRTELIGQPVTAITAAPLLLGERLEAYTRLRCGETVVYESLRRRRDGSTFPIEVTATRLIYEGRELILSVDRRLDLDGAVVVRGERDLHLYMALENASMAVWDWRPGLPSDVLMLPNGKGIGQVLPEDAEKVRQAVTRALTVGQPCDIEFRAGAPDGVVHWLAGQAIPVRDGTGAVTHLLGTVMEITARKRNELAWQDQEPLLKAAFERTFEFIGVLQPNGVMLRTNRISLDFIGVDASAVVGRPFWETPWWAFNAEQRAWLEAAIARCAAGETVLREVTIQGVDGRLACVEFALRPVIDDNGQVVYLIPEAYDITARKALEAELRRREREFATLVETSPDTIARVDRELRILYINPAGAVSLGSTPEFLIGKSYHELGMPTDLTNRWNEALEFVFTTRQPTRIEFEAPGIGGLTTFESTLAPDFDADGNVISIFGISRDITMRKRAEQALRESEARLRLAVDAARMTEQAIQQLNVELERRVEERTFDLELVNRTLRYEIDDRERAERDLAEAFHKLATLNMELEQSGSLLSTIVNSLEDGLALIDRQGTVLMANEALAMLYHMSSEHIVGHAWQDVCAATFPLVALTFEEERMVAARQRIVRADGATAAIDIRTFPLLTGEGKVEQVVLHMADITARLQFEELVIQNERLAASGRLAAIVAHEVNSPLQAIQNFLYLAASDDSSERDEYLGLIGGEITRIGGLIRRLLDIHRPGDTENSSIDGNSLVEKVLTLLGSTLNRQRVRVVCELTAALPLISGRADHLTQILLNLVLNALDAMPRGGILTVRTSFRRPELDDSLELPLPAEVVVIEVADTGAGIPAEVLPQIFEPFYTTKIHGSGLGLAISNQIALQHRGRLIAHNGAEGGAVFTVVLPVQEAEG